MAARLGLPERLHHQSGVPGVVFHQENVNGALVHEWGRVWKARDKRVRIPAAERENAEANFKQVNVKVELLEEALRTQQKRITTLVDEIHTMRQEVDRLKSRSESTATQESIKRLADKIEEVDKKRRDDNEL